MNIEDFVKNTLLQIVNGTKARGGLNIKVVSADYGKGNSNTIGSEIISRIEFNITHRDLGQEKENERSIAHYSKSNPFE